MTQTPVDSPFTRVLFMLAGAVGLLLATAFEREFRINAAAFSASAVIRARRRDSLGARGSR